MSDIVWEDPPDDAQVRGQKRGVYADFVAELKKNQGRWARVPGERTEPSAKNFTMNVRRGAVKGFTKGEFDAVVKDTRVWVVYTGPLEEKP